MRKKKNDDSLDLFLAEKFNQILPRCTVCKFHEQIDNLHYCNAYGTLTYPETLDMCSENDNFEEGRHGRV